MKNADGVWVAIRPAVQSLQRSSLLFLVPLLSLIASGCEMGFIGGDDDLVSIEGPSYDLKVIDMNIAGGMIHEGSPAALAPVLEQINSWNPDIVMLQEVCASQRDHFRDQLAPAGWTVEFVAMFDHPKCAGPIGSLLASKWQMKNVEATPLGHRDGDKVFHLLCADVKTPTPVYACTTHLRAFSTPEANEGRVAQAKRIANILDPIIFNKDKAVVLGGDFNAKPQHTPLDSFYRLSMDNKFNAKGAFHEADQTGSCNSESGGCRKGADTHRKVGSDAGGGKLDYVFFSRNRFSGTGNKLSALPVWTGTSDHALYRARAKVSGGAGDVDARSGGEDEAGSPPPPSLDLANRAVFDANFYLSVYPDLQAAFGLDVAAARNHWLSNGIAEGRVASPIFDPAYYRANNGDLANFANADLLNHYLSYGMAEGRASSPVFNVQNYLSRYDDLRAAFGETNYPAGVAHFLDFGLGEGRQGSDAFSAPWYLANNPDVAQAFGASNYWGAVVHWFGWGRHEGRTGAP